MSSYLMTSESVTEGAQIMHSLEDIRTIITGKIILPVCGLWMGSDTIMHVNPSGRFVIGGPAGILLRAKQREY